MRRLLILSVLLGALGVTPIASVDAQETTQSSAPTDVVPSVVPVTPETLPPDVPPRPWPPQLPVAPSAQASEPATAAAIPVAPPVIKPSASWRNLAQQLRASDQAACRTINGTYDAAFMALLTSLPRFNLRAEVVNSDAGELLASSTDGINSHKIVFVIYEMPAGTVNIKAAPLAGYKQMNASTLKTMLQALNPPAPAKGTL